MRILDLKKELKHLYSPSAKDISVVDVPKMNFLMIDGEGDPNTSKSFQEAVEALFSISYTLKFMFKKGEDPVDYPVMPLEGLWYADDMFDFAANKDLWKWTLMMMQPDLISEAHFMKAMDKLGKKGMPALSRLRLGSYHEGTSAQILYTGPFSEEGPTVQKIHDLIQEKGYSLSGVHHEIYLSDMRRTAPEKLRTVIRQPFR